METYTSHKLAHPLLCIENIKLDVFYHHRLNCLRESWYWYRNQRVYCQKR